MASVNKKSLREEFAALKEQFDDLCAKGQVGAEVRTLFQAFLMLFEILMAVFMEKQTPKTSVNSSKPSSQTEKDQTARSRAGSKGKGPAQNPERAGNTRTIETVESAAVDVCENCGQDLTKIPCMGTERRTRIDIVFEKVVEHVDAEIKQCPLCGAEVRGSFPKGWAGPLQYGSGIKAYLLNLLIAQMLSLKRVQQSIHTLVGQVISQATILKYVMQLHLALEQWEQQAIEQILAQPAIHADETSLRVGGKNHWIHVYAAGDITLKILHRKRGREAIEAIGIIPRYKGVVIHDCWASYLTYNHCGHGLCGSHLLRELTFIVDAHSYAWAVNIKRLLQETCKEVANRESKKLTGQEYKNLQKRYRNILTRGEKELPPIPPKPSGKRGRIAKSDAHNLWERLKLYEKAVLLFAKDADVPFTNNRAERDLRMSKVKQKVSGCFRKEQFARAYCRISSYLQSMAHHGHNPLLAIQMALSGQLDAQRGE